MGDTKKLVCPILSLAETEKDTLCLGEECAWYLGSFAVQLSDGFAPRGCTFILLAYYNIMNQARMEANLVRVEADLSRMANNTNNMRG